MRPKPRSSDPAGGYFLVEQGSRRRKAQPSPFVLFSNIFHISNLRSICSRPRVSFPNRKRTEAVRPQSKEPFYSLAANEFFETQSQNTCGVLFRVRCRHLSRQFERPSSSLRIKVHKLNWAMFLSKASWQKVPHHAKLLSECELLVSQREPISGISPLLILTPQISIGCWNDPTRPGPKTFPRKGATPYGSRKAQRRLRAQAL